KTNAAYALLTASKISAKKGSEFGLVNVLTRSGKAEETAISIAARVAGMPEAAIVSYKKAVRFAERNGFEESVEFERALFGNLWASDGHKKALRDFLSGDGG
ncbi:MAG: hypothetical protein FJ088_05805, partial [Deltaproteobacteria bacterium]|nr:hypothetical protein [Deltaproteobacteria bacterium]